MKACVAFFVLAVVAWTTSAQDASFCSKLDCGVPSGWAKAQQSWDIKAGEYSTEVVPESTCLIGKVQGFKAQVCQVGIYPTLRCEDANKIFVQKNGSPYSRIEVTPYCYLLLRDN